MTTLYQVKKKKQVAENDVMLNNYEYNIKLQGQGQYQGYPFKRCRGQVQTNLTKVLKK